MENLEWGLKMTVLGMGLVFALLGLLWALLTVVLMLDKEPKAEVSPQADDFFQDVETDLHDDDVDTQGGIQGTI